MIFKNTAFFNRYSYLFVFSPYLGTLNNEGGCYWLIVGMLWFKNRIREYLYFDEYSYADYSELIAFIYLLVTLAIISVFAPVHRICYFFFPAASIMYGVIPNSLTKLGNDDYAIKCRNNTIIYCFGLVITGFFWIIYFTGINKLWAPFIVPYSVGF